jgi:hypothetical protein
MKQEIAEKWVAALRSGKYTQTKEMLRSNEDRFCCLGVLCDISGLGEWLQPIWSSQSRSYTVDGAYKSDFLPEAVMQWADIKTSNGVVNGKSLAQLNDEGRSFENIASVIEQNWEQL